MTRKTGTLHKKGWRGERKARGLCQPTTLSPAEIANMGSSDTCKFSSRHVLTHTSPRTESTNFLRVSEWACSLFLTSLLPLQILWFYLLTTNQCHLNSYSSPHSWDISNYKTSILTANISLQDSALWLRNSPNSMSDHLETPLAMSLWNHGLCNITS